MAKKRASTLEGIGASGSAIEHLPLGDLLLDASNPRLPEEPVSEGASQDRLLEMTVDYFDLKELGRSFADRGYFPQEPMVVIGPEGDGKYTVIEGNRRLAALRLLTEADARRRFGDQEWEELADSAKRQNLKSIPCIVSKSRSELNSFLGFRHVSGILQWNPVERARFVHRLIKDEKMDFRQAARAIGSKAPAVQSMFVAYRIIFQAREQFGIDPKGAVKEFGTFYRSLSTAGVREFIGLAREKKTPEECRWPIPRAKADHLAEVLGYMFGDEKNPAVMTDSRQLKQLGPVLASKPALEHLRANRRLEAAYELSEGEEQRLVTYLEKASFALDQALRDVHRHRKSSPVAQRVERCCGSLNEIAKHFPDISQKYFRGE